MTGTHALHYPLDGHPEPGEIRPVAPGVFWVRMPLPYQLDHINLWLLEDEAGWTLVDSGIALDSIRGHWDAVLGHGARRLRRLLVTHFHPDHLGLADWLAQKWKVPVWMSQGELLTARCVHEQVEGYNIPAMVAQFRHHGLDEARVQALLERGHAYRRVVPAVPARFERLMDGDALRIGGRDWQVMMGYGHSPEHAALYCRELSVLIAGDMVLPRISTNISVFAANPNGNPLKLFLDSLARYARLPEDTLVLPSHGAPFRGLQVRVAQLNAHHAARCAELVAAVSEPSTAAELLPVLFPRALDTHQSMFAMGEAIAHLNYLEHAGTLSRVEAGSLARFARSSH